MRCRWYECCDRATSECNAGNDSAAPEAEDGSLQAQLSKETNRRETKLVVQVGKKGSSRTFSLLRLPGGRASLKAAGLPVAAESNDRLQISAPAYQRPLEPRSCRSSKPSICARSQSYPPVTRCPVVPPCPKEPNRRGCPEAYISLG